MGANVELNFEEAVYAAKSGIVIGNHSYIHEPYSSMTLEKCRADIQKAEQLINEVYKQALSVLAKPTGGKTSGFAFYNFENADFRNLSGRYKPNYQDYYNTLIANRRQTAYELHKILTYFGCRPSISTFLKVDYKYHGMQVACIENRDMDLVVRITETYYWDDTALIENRLKEQSESMQKYALRHLWRCTGCSTTHLGVFVQFMGVRHRVCGGGLIGFLWTNPSGEDVKWMETLLCMRCEIIDELSDGIKQNKE